MSDSEKIAGVLVDSPSVKLLQGRNRKAIILFLTRTFTDQQPTISSENLHAFLSDYLDRIQMEKEDHEQDSSDTLEVRAKKYLNEWTNAGFLTNYYDDRGEIFYELSSHTRKTLDWLSSLQKEDYVGTESKFKNIFHLLKELVEFTNEDAEKRIQLLEDKKSEIESQIRKLKMGEDVKVFEEYEIVPRFHQLNQLAKELLSDFKEVEDNFKEITKSIYHQHASGGLNKSDILAFTFEALDTLKDSPQGKSFYAFWSFLMDRSLQMEWDTLTKELYATLQSKEIPANDTFLLGMKKHLHFSGQKVYKANDKMAEKLSRIIRERETSKSEATQQIIAEIKRSLVELSKKGVKPEISFELETDVDISIPFERKLTYEASQEQVYAARPTLAETDITQSETLNRLFAQTTIDRDTIRGKMREILKSKSQATLQEIIESAGGIEKGLAELFGYIGVAKEFRHTIDPGKQQRIVFNPENGKSILIPEIIVSR